MSTTRPASRRLHGLGWTAGAMLPLCAAFWSEAAPLPTTPHSMPGGSSTSARTAHGPASRAGEKVEFNRDIRPILAANCFACHGQDATARQANLRLDLRDAATARRGGSPAIAPGQPEHSGLVTRIRATNALQMPPPSSGHVLTAEQKRLLTEWVRQGAPYATHWSFAPVRRPALPAVRTRGWVRSPVDAFVLARLERAGLAPAPEADRYTLLRRVSLDLTGLPPTPEEATAFVSDRSANAYEKVVDRLLASPRYGEHWARAWLDLARYADTQGYEKDQPRTIWRYRDWVIDAFNRDLPYDRFTIEQLAGDLLPNPSPSQLLATAFNRNTMTNTEGGVDGEEFRVAAVKDRVDTTMQVWMGLTMGCAKCHTHKYDPITQADYYHYYALFNQSEDANRGDEFPTATTPTDEEARRLAALDDKMKGLREAVERNPPPADRQRAWEEARAGERLWTRLTAESATAAGGAALRTRSDGALLVSGAHPERDRYTVTLPLPAAGITSLRLEVLKDPSLPNGGPGRSARDQNVVMSEIRAAWLAPGGTAATPVPLINARADFEQGGWPASAAVDGKGETGWAFSPQTGQPHVAIFDLQRPLPGAGGKLILTIEQNYPELQLGCFRVSVSGAEPGRLRAELGSLDEIAAVPSGQRTPAEQRRLDEAFRREFEPTAALYRQIDALEKERAALDAKSPRTPVMRDLPAERRRVTRIHQRGNFLDPGDVVEPAVPAAFGPLPAGAPANRLGAALWLVSPSNPLTSRVAVNRVWARLFGTGLVETEEDFGTQGTPPTHPELLDFLAFAFSAPAPAAGSPPADARSAGLGWSVKKLLRLIVTSAAYRQSSEAAPAKLAADPRNLLLSRGPRFRLPAEVIRDQALAVSGLLSAKMSGPSVMPPQPDGLWKTVYSGLRWQTSAGEDRYRRALYTFWRRTSPYPSLTTFDAGSGEFCVIRRVRTNTPLQALVTLNDPAFVEAAGALGAAMLRRQGTEPRERVAYGLHRVLARPGTPAEITRLTKLLDTALADFRTRPEAARLLLTAANVKPAPDRDPAEQAAFTVVANVLLNLDETLTKP